MQAAQIQAYEVGTVLYMAMELSNSKWKLGFGNGTKLRRKSIAARDRKCLLAEVALAKARLKLPEEAPVVCCFEAGRDGHWIYRWLESAGFEVLEIDSSSIETARGRKHVKTDRVDVERATPAISTSLQPPSCRSGPRPRFPLRFNHPPVEAGHARDFHIASTTLL